MNVRTSPSSRRSSSRRKRSSVRARSGSDSMTRSMYSTWKIALRERLGRAVVDLLGEPRALGLLGLDDPHLDVARGRRAADLGRAGCASPRSRKSHVRSRVRWASSSLASSAWWSPRSAVERRRRRRGGPAGGRRRRRPRRRRRRDRRAPSPRCVGRGRRAARGRRRRARRGAPASGRAPRRRPRGSARGRCAACSRCSRPPPSPPRGVRRSGCPVHRSRRVLAPSDFGVYGSALMGRRPRRRGRRRADRVAAGRVGAEVELAEAGGARRRPCRGRPASCRAVRARSGRRCVPGNAGSWARSRTSRGGSSGRASDGIRLRLGQPDREVGDDRAGGRVERVADRPPSGGSSSANWAAVVARPAAEGRAAARPRRAASRRSPSAGPSQATGRVQPQPGAEPGDHGVEGEQRREDEQHLDRPGGVEERAPRRRDREDEARDEERDDATATRTGRMRRAAACHGSAEQADERDRQARQEQDGEQVVGEARRPASRPAGPARPRDSATGSAGRSRRRCRSR